MVPADEGFVLARPSKVASGEGLFLTSREAEDLRLWLLNEGDLLDGDYLDSICDKIAAFIYSEMKN